MVWFLFPSYFRLCNVLSLFQNVWKQMNNFKWKKEIMFYVQIDKVRFYYNYGLKIIKPSQMDQWKNMFALWNFIVQTCFQGKHAFLNIEASCICKSACSEISHISILMLVYPSLQKQSNWDKNIFSNYSYSLFSIFWRHTLAVSLL